MLVGSVMNKEMEFPMELSHNAVDPSVLQFVEDARAFCTFIEGLVIAKPSNCYARLLQLLSSLAASGNKLPDTWPEHEVLGDGGLTHEEWSRLARSLGGVLAPETSNLVERDKADESELGRVTMLWDDLADIYRDLKKGLDSFASDTTDAQSAAIWDWRFGYEYHWGCHLMQALVTIHEILFDRRAE